MSMVKGMICIFVSSVEEIPNVQPLFKHACIRGYKVTEDGRIVFNGKIEIYDTDACVYERMCEPIAVVYDPELDQRFENDP